MCKKFISWFIQYLYNNSKNKKQIFNCFYREEIEPRQKLINTLLDESSDIKEQLLYCTNELIEVKELNNSLQDKISELEKQLEQNKNKQIKKKTPKKSKDVEK